MNRRRLFLATGSLALAGHAAAQPSWPDRPVTIIVPFGAGTAPDLMARLAAPTLGARWGQPVVVQNAPGAAGAVGVERAARAAPDGHTLVLPGDAAIVVRVSMTPRPPYDPQRDLAPIMLVGRTTNVLVVSGQTSHRSLSDLVAAARAQPGTVTFGHAGTGTSQHIGAEMLAQMAGVRLTGVAYNDLGAMAIDVQSGRVTMSLMGSVTALPRVRDGSLRALGVSSPERFSALPEVPTIAEQGLPGFDASAWFGLYAPAGTPGAIVARINADMRAALEQPEARSRFETLGVRVVAGTPEELAQTIAAEIPRMRAVLRAAGVEGA
jgi:tripartite-type tricarboxylate transporter receptor subunit TctC